MICNILFSKHISKVKDIIGENRAEWVQQDLWKWNIFVETENKYLIYTYPSLDWAIVVSLVEDNIKEEKYN